MTCTESKMMILMRPEELTTAQSAELGRHVERCAECAAYLAGTKSTLRGLESLRSFEPVPDDPQTLTADILTAVENARRRGAAGSSGFYDRFLEVFTSRPVRIVYGTLALGSIGLFFVQQLGSAADIQSLEEKLIRQGNEKAGMQVVYAVPSNLVNRLPRSEELQSYLETAPPRKNDGRLVVDKTGLSKIVSIVGNAIFRSANIVKDDASRKRLESLMETLQRSASARVIIRTKERS